MIKHTKRHDRFYLSRTKVRLSLT